VPAKFRNLFFLSLRSRQNSQRQPLAIVRSGIHGLAMTLNPKIQKANPLDIATLEKRLRDLLARGRQLNTEQVALETARSEITPPQPGWDIGILAQSLACGTDQPGSRVVHSTGSRLYQVIAERQAIPLAIEMIQRQLVEAVQRRAAAEFERRAAEWQAMLRQTVDTIWALQRINRAREKLQKDILGGGMIHLPGTIPAFKIGGTGRAETTPAGFNEFMSLMLKLEIVTRAEAAKAQES
jgi:hypothetical protein